MRVFLQTTLVAVSIAIVAGFFAVGSPFSERLRRFDERRVSDLQSIQFQVVDYWQTKGKLPERLEDLRDDFRGFIPLNDPETSEPYEYRTTGELSFELCASFKTSNKTVDGKSVEGSPLQLSRPIPAEPFGFESNFLHDAQRTCFSRTIDPDRFPLVKPRPL